MPNLVVDTDQSPRLDKFVSDRLTGLSRAYIQKLIKLQKIHINGNPAKASDKLKNNDKVFVDYDFEENQQIESISLPIIYEDEDVIVIDKPAGVLTHSKGAFNPESTVSSFIQSKSPNLVNEKDGIVHRLDRATSGVIITAKNVEAKDKLQKQFSTRKVKKVYIAVVGGHLKDKEAVIDMPIARNPKQPSTFRTNANGKPSVTNYKVVDSSTNYDLVKLKPKTGRTHQLRVHMAKLGHPILGDTLYKGGTSDRLYLHSRSLEIMLPNGEVAHFESPLPKEFNELIENDG